MIAAQFYAAWSDRLPDAEPHMDPSLVRFIRRGGAVTARDYLRAVARVEEYWREAQTFLERFDVLLMPTVATLPFAAGAHPPREIAGQEVSVLGWMAVHVPVQSDGPACRQRARGMDRGGASCRAADRRPPPTPTRPCWPPPPPSKLRRPGETAVLPCEAAPEPDD
jgi:hypothetical protein